MFLCDGSLAWGGVVEEVASRQPVLEEVIRRVVQLIEIEITPQCDYTTFSYSSINLSLIISLAPDPVCCAQRSLSSPAVCVCGLGPQGWYRVCPRALVSDYWDDCSPSALRKHKVVQSLIDLIVIYSVVKSSMLFSYALYTSL
jgi:hypothetical protein